MPEGEQAPPKAGDVTRSEGEQLFQIDWNEVIGGSGEAEWREDRLRKFGRIKADAPALAQLQDQLAEEAALYRCSPEILQKHPSSAEWYIELACFAGKTLANLQGRAKTEFKLSVLPETFAQKLKLKPEGVTPEDRAAFSAWINTELEELMKDDLDEPRLAGLHVAMIRGGRFIGQGQNEGGDAAVRLLKSSLLAHYGPAICWSCRADDAQEWRQVEKDLESALETPVWRHEETGTIFDFRAGGNRPDLRVTRGEVILLVAEVKGRKDRSNIWESWMPTVVSHIETWAESYPGIACGVFMTLFTEDMVTGVTPKSHEVRPALRKLHEDHKLHFAINLSHLAVNKELTLHHFKQLFDPILIPPDDDGYCRGVEGAG